MRLLLPTIQSLTHVLTFMTYRKLAQLRHNRILGALCVLIWDVTSYIPAYTASIYPTTRTICTQLQKFYPSRVIKRISHGFVHFSNYLFPFQLVTQLRDIVEVEIFHTVGQIWYCRATPASFRLKRII